MPGSDTAALLNAPAAQSVLVQVGRDYWLFRDPERTIVAHDIHEVLPALRELEEAVSAGAYAAGFLTYEAAAAFDLAVYERSSDGLPLLWFGIYPDRQRVTLPPSVPGRYEVGAWQAALGQRAYTQIVHRIKAHIANGDTYQVNYTMPLRATFSGEAWALFCDLATAQQAGHVAYVDLGRFAICSASPELFFVREGRQIVSRPMKGTARRGRTSAEDEAAAAELQASEKNRAENVMIVDMIRNDLGRIAATGSVRVPALFEVEHYPTLLQMTSTVTADTEATAVELLQAMFPCASITGAPKVRTMQIIRELEQGPRGVYTGSIGYFGPGQQAAFNVAIRTVLVDRQDGRAAYHVGSGIVWDSDPAQEYAECLLKAEVLLRRRPPFELLETMRWSAEEGYALLDPHLARLTGSAAYFGFVYEESAVRRELEALAQGFRGPQRVRLLLGQSGAIAMESAPLPEQRAARPLRITLARTAISADNIWLYHKTTQRAVYDEALAGRPGYDDVLMWNEEQMLTEATKANIVLQIDGRLLTPPVSAGLLPGTLRQVLLAQGIIETAPLTIADLARCEALFLINSVRGWQAAAFIQPSLAIETG